MEDMDVQMLTIRWWCFLWGGKRELRSICQCQGVVAGVVFWLDFGFWVVLGREENQKENLVKLINGWNGEDNQEDPNNCVSL